jgi:hypothetical protein
VALDTRLGCLADDLSKDSEAQQMITAANDTFDALNITENSLPVWKLWPTNDYKRLIAAQEIFTE